MNRFDDDLDGEPVAVVRVFGDFALALSVTLMLLVGTRSSFPLNGAVEAQAALRQAGATNKMDLALAVTQQGQFVALSADAPARPTDAASLVKQWLAVNQRAPSAVAVRFQSAMPAGDLHKALLQLQSVVGPTVSIRTYPAL